MATIERRSNDRIKFDFGEHKLEFRRYEGADSARDVAHVHARIGHYARLKKRGSFSRMPILGAIPIEIISAPSKRNQSAQILRTCT